MSSGGSYTIFMRPNEDIEVAKAAKALSDPIRLRILTLLRIGREETYESPVCSAAPSAVCPADLLNKLGDISSSKLSYHLKELKEEGFIRECREGKRIYYLPVPERFERFVQELGRFYG